MSRSYPAALNLSVDLSALFCLLSGHVTGKDRLRHISYAESRTMHSTQTTATADLEMLATELATRGFQTTLRAPGDGAPCLTVRNPRASVLTEMVYADGGSFWWSWREPIAACDQVTTAAGILARVLRAVGE
jgi:hypothetical protein